jgi:hypothetical protein
MVTKSSKTHVYEMDRVNTDGKPYRLKDNRQHTIGTDDAIRVILQISHMP